jgi:O-antigen biosynthesis protein
MTQKIAIPSAWEDEIPYIGWFEGIENGRLCGWIIAKPSPALESVEQPAQPAPLMLLLRLSQKILGSFAVSLPRGDVEQAFGVKEVGFAINLRELNLPVSEADESFAFSLEIADTPYYLPVRDTRIKPLDVLLAPIADLEQTLFNESWYLNKYPEVRLLLSNHIYASGAEHFHSKGFLEKKHPSPFFDPIFYENIYLYNPANERLDHIEHYLDAGIREQFSPHWLFDEQFYRHDNADITDAIRAGALRCGFEHFIRSGQYEAHRCPHPLFNRFFYAEQNNIAPEQAMFTHFALIGHAKNLSCTPLFDEDWYADNYRQHVNFYTGLGKPCVTAFQHFLMYGMAEGFAPLPDFDSDYYRTTYLEQSKALAKKSKSFNPVQHWIYEGLSRGYNPNKYFSSQYYLEHNPDVIAEIKQFHLRGAFEHFIWKGHKRGLRCGPPMVSLTVAEDDAKVIFARKARIAADQVKRNGLNFAQTDPAKTCALSIVIPIHNHLDFTLFLLSELASRYAGFNSEIIVIDNASNDGSQRLESFVRGIQVIRNDKNLGFPTACNQGWQCARGEIVLFANNDIELTPGALEAALDIFATNADIGAVGARIIRSHGLLQEAGSILWQNGGTGGIGRDDDPLHANYAFQQDVHFCSAAFLFVRKNLLAQIQGFDEDYSPGYYEEVDLCSRIWEAGYRVVYSPRITIYHFEYASFAKGRPPSAAYALMQRHRQVLMRKQRAFLHTCLTPDKVFERYDLVKPDAAKKVLLVEDMLPLPIYGAGFGRANTVIWELHRAGYAITLFIIIKQEERREALDQLPAHGIQIIYQADSKAPLHELVAAHDYAVLWLCRTHNGRRFEYDLQQIKNLPMPPRIIFDTEALEANRHAALANLDNDCGADLAAPAQIYLELVAGASYADVVLAVSAQEQGQIAQSFPAVQTRILSFVMTPAQNPGLSFAERQGFLFVGGVHSELTPNYDGLLWFVRHVWPILTAQMPDAVLDIVGYWGVKLAIPAELHAHPGIRFIGTVKDLDRYYAKARVFIAPTRFAAGIPHKVYEAASHGLPSVVTRLLAGQVGWNEEDGLISASHHDPADFAGQCIKLHQQEQLWHHCAAQALRMIARDCAAENFRNTIVSILDEASPPKQHLP